MKTMKMKSRVAIMGLAAVMCTFAVATPAFADQTWNSGFEFNLHSPSSDTGGSGWRQKDNNSPTFIWAKILSAPCQVFVDGSNDWGNSHQDCTVNGRAYLNQVGSFVINQNVNEWHYHQAELTGWVPWGNSYAKGEWSPDSYGSYPSINA